MNADLEPAPPIGEPTCIREFQHQSVLGLFGLSIITLGIYVPVWLDRQAKIIARILPRDPVSRELVVAVYVLYIASVAWIVPLIWIEFTPPTAGDHSALLLIELVDSLLDWTGMICMLVLTFKVRNRIHAVIGARPQSERWFSGLLTFFFSVLYLQYKINRVRRRTPMGFCTECGYNLSGLPEPRCPECGTPFNPEAHNIAVGRPAPPE